MRTPSATAVVHKPLAEAVTRDVGHVEAELLLDRLEVVDQHVGGLAVRVQQPRLVQEAHEVPGFLEHLVKVVGFDHHLGRV